MDLKTKVFVNNNSIKVVLAYDCRPEYQEIFVATIGYNVKSMSWVSNLENINYKKMISNPDAFLKKVNDYRLLIYRIEEALKEEKHNAK